MEIRLVRQSIGKNNYMLDCRRLGGNAAVRLDHCFVEIRTAIGLQRSETIGNPVALSDLSKRQGPVPARIESQNTYLIRRVHNVGGSNRRRFGQIELGAAFTA